jgi:lincosamide nucleotidyltransferase
VTQHTLIARVAELCAADDRIHAALTYGSIPQGVGDRYSDIEFWLFGTVPDAEAWCRDIGPVNAIVRNEFGAHVVFFPGLIRGEFHFAAGIDAITAWPSRGAPVDRMVIKDPDGALRAALTRLPADAPVPSTPAEVEELCGRYANWLVLALNVSARGEAQRTYDALGTVRRYLLWMARLDAGATQTWLTPSRRAETELPPSITGRLTDAVTIAEAWALGRELWERLAERYRFAVPVGLFAEIDTRA